MKVGDDVICIGEHCYKLKQGGIYKIYAMWSDNTITLYGYETHYSMQLFISLYEHRRNSILKIKEKIKKEVK